MQFGRNCLPNIAISLCIGENDFLPNFHGHSHEKWLLKISQTPSALNCELQICQRYRRPVEGFVNNEAFLDIIKRMYCIPNVNADATNVTLTAI